MATPDHIESPVPSPKVPSTSRALRYVRSLLSLPLSPPMRARDCPFRPVGASVCDKPRACPRSSSSSCRPWTMSVKTRNVSPSPLSPPGSRHGLVGARALNGHPRPPSPSLRPPSTRHRAPRSPTPRQRLSSSRSSSGSAASVLQQSPGTRPLQPSFLPLWNCENLQMLLLLSCATGPRHRRLPVAQLLPPPQTNDWTTLVLFHHIRAQPCPISSL